MGLSPDRDLVPTSDRYSLLTDLYELTMAACYAGERVDDRRASFELFARKLPSGYGYAIAMGLEQAIEYVQNFHFTGEQIAALRETQLFESVGDRFWDLLETARFSGDLWAVPEGTAVFPNEPFLRIEAPFWEAQILETYLLNTLNYQTRIATQAARIRDVAGESARLLEFGSRRAFSPQASMWAARAALAAGFDSTSNVLTALQLGCKPTGTMAHALVMGLTALEGSEDDAFIAFHKYFPGAPLLVDTYDTIAAVKRLKQKVEAGEMEVKGVRLDSGDIAALSKEVRSLLPDIAIFASGDLDEYEIANLLANGATIDGYGIGTKLVSGTALNGVYKLVEIDGKPVMKRSSGKVTYPGKKQIFRQFDRGLISRDRLGLIDEAVRDGEIPLLERVIADGKLVKPADSLEAIAKRTRESMESLPPDTRRIEDATPIPVDISDALQSLTDRVISTNNEQ